MPLQADLSITSETASDREVNRLRGIIAAQRRREAELLALQETILDLQHLRDTDDLLRELVKRARRFVGSDFSYLSTRDDERGEYATKSNDNAITSHFKTLRMAESQGVLGHIVATSAPFFTTDYASDTRFVHDPVVDEAMSREGVTSMLGVPLLLAGRTLGVFFVADRRPRRYLPSEISMLSALASHAALALENARLLAEARDANIQIEEQRRATAVADEAHGQMTDLAARGGSIDDLADLLERQLGGAVTILDAASRPVFSKRRVDSRGAKAPAGQVVRLALADSRRLARSIEVADWPGARIVSVVGGGELLGGLMFEKAGRFTQAEIRTLERAANVMGIVLMSQERITLRAHREVNDLLTALLSGGTIDRRLEADAIRMGLQLSSYPQLLMLDGPSARTAHGLEEASRLLRAAASLVGIHDGRLVAFIKSDAPGTLAEALIRRLREAGIEETRIAISRPIASLDKVEPAHRSCRQLLKLQAKLGGGGAVLLEEQLGLYATLFEGQNARQIEAFVNACIGPLIARDRTTGSALADTLLTHLDHGHSVRATAAALHVHVNTVRQRLETIGAVLPQWAGPGLRLEVHAALRLQRIMRAIS